MRFPAIFISLYLHRLQVSGCDESVTLLLNQAVHTTHATAHSAQPQKKGMLQLEMVMHRRPFVYPSSLNLHLRLLISSV
jgi:hypothetical protein